MVSVGVASNWLYGASLNFYRLQSGGESFGEIDSPLELPVDRQLYVLYWPRDESFSAAAPARGLSGAEYRGGSRHPPRGGGLARNVSRGDSPVIHAASITIAHVVATSERSEIERTEQHSASLKRELRLPDLVLLQVLLIVGLPWIGLCGEGRRLACRIVAGGHCVFLSAACRHGHLS